MTNLRKNIKKSIPDPDEIKITRWAQDPYSLGSYSYIPVNAFAKDCDFLAEPVNDKLFFAGEATHKVFLATTHGAYLSGLREANRIIKSSLNFRFNFYFLCRVHITKLINKRFLTVAAQKTRDQMGAVLIIRP